ncbi:MAG: hypothetical protein EAZ65_01415 [Verrucomicrobia bacterium]|nr:MAG: hypothetical protein EAZ84_06330 [Verrucomicrobiota bacterium]TAE89141.1 MAG: hypothetical protein EAZ82_00485 [Verrucomicrobiota bacterium]TAF27985.1 MAG: hypothetical protein EAZ71_01420 [Verrucomicrobiota bacterium]TAF42832.1 MAG: hypothetical protein EAZ65_01415 [Verrucomicrobiota bacterium]
MTFRILLALIALPTLAVSEENFIPDIAANVTRPWPGKDFWSNPAEDWMVSKGRIENAFSGGNRNVVLLTASINESKAPFNVRVHLDQVSFELFGEGFVGLQVGLRGSNPDFREAAVDGTGFPVGIDFSGKPFIGSIQADQAPLPLPLLGLVLELKGEPADGDLYHLSLLVQDATGKILRSIATEVHQSWLTGLISLTSSTRPAPLVDLASARPSKVPPLARDREGEGRFAFSKLVLTGGKFTRHPERAFGPVQWVTHTFDNDGTLCLLAQAATFSRNEKLEAELHLPGREPQFATLDPISRSARFRVIRLDPTKELTYEVKLAGESFKGTIRGTPRDRPITIASLTGNHSTEGSGLPDPTIIANVSAHAPDFISFHGGQIDENTGGYGQIYDHRPGDRALICYLRKYALHGWAWRELLRSTPSVTLPGDRDVFHQKLWGANGMRSDITNGYGAQAEDSGGYKMSVEFVNAVHRTQTGNLPDPADPAPCASGISVYFTRHAWGPLDFLILSDHQFKSAPKPLLPAARITKGWPLASDWNAATDATVEDASLLGTRQEAFVDRWTKSPAKGSKFRIALSQHPFLALRTFPAELQSDELLTETQTSTADDEAKADFVANAWPSAPRAKTLDLLASVSAFHLCGGPFPAATGRYSKPDGSLACWWANAAPSIPAPAIRWAPAKSSKGNARDAFGHPFELDAVANSASGYLITRWEPGTGEVRIENWPAKASPQQAAPDNRPFEGWPVTISGKSQD